MINAVENLFFSFNNLEMYGVGGCLQKALYSTLEPRNSGMIFPPVFKNSDLILVDIK